MLIEDNKTAKYKVGDFATMKKTVTREDVEAFKKALLTLFQGDFSSARPDGSMTVRRMYWWEHENAIPSASAAQIQEAFTITRTGNNNRFDDYDIKWELDGCVEPEIFNM